ncbi:MAG TPA: L,D-transpeptidase [Longimicrobium sp.]|nr:L,D-transpeptidase [Longimicrobium sp.]
MRVVTRRYLAPALALLALGASAPAAAPEPPSASTAEGFHVLIDLSERRLYLRDGDEVLDSYAVAVGQPNHPTPTGTFHIRRLVWNPRWVPPDSRWAKGKRPRDPGDPRNPMGRVKIFFSDPDYYIHGTRDVDSLGEAESHGCVRMRNGDAITVARRVMRNGGEPRDPSWFRRVIDRVTSTREVSLSDPVLVRIQR